MKEICNSTEAGLYLIVTKAGRIGVKSQYVPVIFYSVGNCVGASKHPFERGVRKAGFIFWVAATYVSVVSWKPNLLKSKIAAIITIGPPVLDTPIDASESSSVFVD